MLSAQAQRSANQLTGTRTILGYAVVLQNVMHV